MWRTVLGQALRRPGRSLAVVAAIVVAAVSFSLLSASVATSRLEVQGTVEVNFRTAYDILVRPKHSRTGLEETDQLVRENYLSGIYGGITLKQYARIKAMDGVEVAAPVAMVGYVLPSLFLKEKITDAVTDDHQQVFRLTPTWVSDRGLSRYPGAVHYTYVTDQPLNYRAGEAQQDPVTGEKLRVCGSFERNLPAPRSAFDIDRSTLLGCWSTSTPNHDSGLPLGQIGTGVQYPFPLLMAAVDPEQEAALVGLDDAVTQGRYLTSHDKGEMVCVGCGTPSGRTSSYRQIPVLMADEPLVDEHLRLTWERLDVGAQPRVPGRLAGENGLAWLKSRPAQLVRTETLQPKALYQQLLAAYANPDRRVKTQYWSVGQVDYRRAKNGHLAPTPRHLAPARTWEEHLYPEGFFAPPASADTPFRALQVHTGYDTFDVGMVSANPQLLRVGTFDPELIEGFSPLSRVPLTTYFPPSADPGDTRSKLLLGGKTLRPNSNLAGYLQQPPMMLTTLSALPTVSSPSSFTGTDKLERAPISVIRVRVAGVTGSDALSREKVRVAAERIARATGLDVDITIGSSPTPKLIDLPAGEYGRPALTLKEGWVRKGVTVELLDAIDKKSLALFGLVLLVCLLFLLNATIAAARTRRVELGVLACLGWPPLRIFALLELELLATGVLAGIIGTTLAAAVVDLFDLRIAWWQLAAITPVATLLAAAAGIWPAWRACRARPLDAITPAVRAPRGARRVTSIARLSFAGLIRWPGRTILGASSLFIGVAALAVLIAIQTGFQGDVTGTLLGDAIAVQVRHVDYIAAALTIGLGASAVADIAYLNITERAAEIGTLRASGWGERHLRRLFGTEALLTASLGAVLGALLGATAVHVLLQLSWSSTIAAAATASSVGIIAALLALTLPLSRLTKLTPATAIGTE